MPLLTEPSSAKPLTPPLLQSPFLNVAQLSVLSMWFLKARCSLLFTIKNHSHKANLPCVAITLLRLLNIDPIPDCPGLL